MKRFTLAAVAVLAIAGSTAVYAQRSWLSGHMHHMRMSPEDRAAFMDARIAAVHAGLKLTPDQEKLWPPVESAVRDLVKLRIDRANARMKAAGDDQDAPKVDDPVARLRERADTMAVTAEAMKKIADAADPLYKTLDDGQKRRLTVLTHHARWFGPEGGAPSLARAGRGGWAGFWRSPLRHGADAAYGSDGDDETSHGRAYGTAGRGPRLRAALNGAAPAVRAVSAALRWGKPSGRAVFLVRSCEKSLSLAGHPGIALLNDRLLQRPSGRKFRAHSSVGRAADS